MRIIKPINKISDQRGYLIEIMKDGTWKQINHSFTKAKEIRGNHYHKNCHEFFYIIRGELILKIKDVYTKKEQVAIMKQGDCFIVEPNDIHTIETLTDIELIVLLSEPFDSNNPDLYKEDGLQQI